MAHTIPTPVTTIATPRDDTDPHPALPPPHGPDQSITNVAEAPDPVMQQAKRDVDAGLVDTDMHATPGLDAALRKKMVPGPGGQPPPRGGA